VSFCLAKLLGLGIIMMVTAAGLIYDQTSG
jgi:hypothetical protein